MVTINDLTDAGAAQAAKLLGMSVRGEIIPNTVFEECTENTLRYYVETMEHIRSGV